MKSTAVVACCMLALAVSVAMFGLIIPSGSVAAESEEASGSCPGAPEIRFE